MLISGQKKSLQTKKYLREYVLILIVLCPWLEFYFTLIVSLHSEQFTSDILSIWDYDLSVDQYNVYGGTGKASVTAQIENLQTWLQQWTHLQTWLQQLSCHHLQTCL